jgi:hypothetical protein
MLQKSVSLHTLFLKRLAIVSEFFYISPAILDEQRRNFK